MKVFISWSGARSLHIAKALYDWMPDVVQSIQPFMSQKSIGAGDRWGIEIATKLEECNFGIICLTADNLLEPWILFEAGALAKSLQVSKVVPLLHDVEFRQLEGPLAQFQGKRLNKIHLYELMQSLNASNASGSLPEDRLEASFEAHWPKLEVKVASTPDLSASADVPPKRGANDILEEVVERLRSIQSYLNVNPSSWPYTEPATQPNVELGTEGLNQAQLNLLFGQMQKRYPNVGFGHRTGDRPTMILGTGYTRAAVEEARATIAGLRSGKIPL